MVGTKALRLRNATETAAQAAAGTPAGPGGGQGGPGAASATTLTTTAASTSALLGTTLAEKNNLTIGSTFTINDQTFTVAGLFDSGTTFGNNALYVTLPAAQTLAALPDELSSVIITVNT